MRRTMTGVWGLLLLVLLVWPSQAHSALPPNTPTPTQAVCVNGQYPDSAALYQFCLPAVYEANWNGDLIVYAPEYRFPFPPVPTNITYNPLVESFLTDVIIAQGYAFATTSFSVNGLNVVEGRNELPQLVELFTARYGAPQRVYLIGISQGGLIGIQIAEQQQQTFDGVLALCGIYAGYDTELDYVGDFRLVFDYLFPGILIGSPDEIPQEMIDNWQDPDNPTDISDQTKYRNRAITAALQAPDTLRYLLRVTGAPVSDNLLDNITTLGTVLTFQVYGTNDAAQKIGGEVGTSLYDNQNRVYSGSGSETIDQAINAGVARFSMTEAVSTTLATTYDTSGHLRTPLVTMHTTRDPLVPYNQAEMYQQLVDETGSSTLYRHIAVERYNHCNFTTQEVENALTQLIDLVDTSQQRRIWLPLVTR